MPTITNGVVEFERQLRPADYENKRVKVTLSFAVDDDDDPETAMAVVADMAWAQVFKTLRKPETATAAPPAQPAPKPAVVKPPAAVVKMDAAEAAQNAMDGLDDRAIKQATVEPEGSILPLVTDAEIDKVIFGVRGRGVSPEQIKAEIFKATGVVGQSVKTLDQEKRPAFVDAIKALHATTAAEAAQ